jgi:cytochrome c-type biogenesis protein CcmH/NrfF
MQENMQKSKARVSRRVVLFGGALAASCVTALAQEPSSSALTPDVKRVGLKLACLCGGCNNSVGDCPMIGCHYCEPARAKIATMQKSGSDDKTIVDAFVADQGLKALVSPPTEGFSLVGWIMPFIATALGLGAVIIALKKLMKPAPAGTPVIDNAVLDRYREQIEKDSEKLE